MLIRTGSFEIRTVTQKDRAAVLQIYRLCEDFLALCPKSKASPAMVRKDLADSDREGARFCGIFASRGEMVGVVEFLPAHFEGKPQLPFLSLLMIAAPHRNRGLGASVLQSVEREIRKDPKVTAILSAVQVNNPRALRFWRKNGYRVISGPELRSDQTTTVRLRKDFISGARKASNRRKKGP